MPPGIPATASRARSTSTLCQNVKWCHTGCIYGAKNTVNTNYLGAAEDAGVVVRPARRWSASAARRRTATATSSRRRCSTGRGRTRAGSRPGKTEEIECKVLILAAGAMGNPPILMRSRSDLPTLSGRLGRHLGINGDHIAAVEYDRRRSATCSACRATASSTRAARSRR